MLSVDAISMVMNQILTDNSAKVSYEIKDRKDMHYICFNVFLTN